MNSYTEEGCNEILKKMTPHKDYKIDDYYGVAIMERMADATYDIRVIHTYDSKSGKSKFSSTLNVQDWDTAKEVHDILQMKAKKKVKPISAFDLTSILSAKGSLENSLEKKEEVEEVEEEVNLDEDRDADRDADLEDKIQSFKHPLDSTLTEDEALILWTEKWDKELQEIYQALYDKKEGKLTPEQELMLIKARSSYQEKKVIALAPKPY